MIKGLSSSDARELLTKFGQNKIAEAKPTSPFLLFVNQFKNLFSVMLLAAVILSILVNDILDGILIFIILILNTSLGFWQEYKASREIRSLKSFESPKSRVIRDGFEQEILSEDLVPGDIVVLEAGSKIPADGVLIEGFGISVNESSLTGESNPVSKSTDHEENYLLLGTWVVSGKCQMEITSTGKNTKFGIIAENLGEIKEEPTPLELSLKSLAIKITLLILGIAGIVALMEISRGVNIFEVFLSTIALIIAAIPEGLTAIITVILAIGARRMYKKNSLIRRIDSIENLGTTDVICIDKTGTITKNEMTVRNFELYDKKNLDDFIKTAILCNNSSILKKDDDNSFDILGDTMEGALLIWAEKQNKNIEQIRNLNKIIKQVPFDPKRKMMSVIIDDGSSFSLFAKGAPEIIFSLCDLSESETEKFEKYSIDMESRGLRVLAFACKRNINKNDSKFIENNLEFLGIAGIADEPRPEAKEAIATARKAGIEIVMITGDNPITANAIAKEVGLIKKDDEIITGDELDKLSDIQLTERLNNIRIYARTTPEHKLRIVTAFQQTGKVVAVTGDGVNDSLALKKAHIGISMGITGTDVAKEASDIIILDDNLSTIITAIEQGRLIYRNIVKAVEFLFTGNLSEVLLIVVVTLLGFPIPLLPAQILWINFVTDGLPAISLAAEKSSKKEMLLPPRGKDTSLFNLKTLRFISFFGILISTISIVAFIIVFNSQGIENARKITFTTMILSQMFFVLFVVRRGSSILSNKYLLASVIIVVIFQILILTLSPLKLIFGI